MLVVQARQTGPSDWRLPWLAVLDARLSCHRHELVPAARGCTNVAMARGAIRADNAARWRRPCSGTVTPWNRVWPSEEFVGGFRQGAGTVDQATLRVIAGRAARVMDPSLARGAESSSTRAGASTSGPTASRAAVSTAIYGLTPALVAVHAHRGARGRRPAGSGPNSRAPSGVPQVDGLGNGGNHGTSAAGATSQGSASFRRRTLAGNYGRESLVGPDSGDGARG